MEKESLEIHIVINDFNNLDDGGIYKISGSVLHVMGTLTSALHSVSKKAGISSEDLKQLTLDAFDRYDTMK